jgi:hypothetical protein
MRGRLKKTWAVATLGVVLFLVASFEQPLAQGLGGLGQLLGGGGSGGSGGLQQFLGGGGSRQHQ